MYQMTSEKCERSRSKVSHDAEIHLFFQVFMLLLQMQVFTQQTLVARAFLTQILLQLFGTLRVGFNL